MNFLHFIIEGFKRTFERISSSIYPRPRRTANQNPATEDQIIDEAPPKELQLPGSEKKKNGSDDGTKLGERKAERNEYDYILIQIKQLEERLLALTSSQSILDSQIDEYELDLSFGRNKELQKLRTSKFLKGISQESLSIPSLEAKYLEAEKKRIERERREKRRKEREKIAEKEAQKERRKKRREEELRQSEIQKLQAIRIKNESIQESGTEYYNRIIDRKIESFDQIRKLARRQSDQVFYGLNHGINVLYEYEQLEQYMQAYGRMHKLKILQAIDSLQSQNEIPSGLCCLIDWGCGQALASSVLIDYLKENNESTTLSRLILMDASEIALKRGVLHINKLTENWSPAEISVAPIDLNNVSNDHLENLKPSFIHIFSNILDIDTIDVRKIFAAISRNCKGSNLFIIVSPSITEYRTNRLRTFRDYFENVFGIEHISERSGNIPHPRGGKDYTRYEICFKTYIT